MKVGFNYITEPSRRRVGLSVLIGIIVGIIGAIAKWGWEVPFPPRNPDIFWPVDAMSRVTPPKVVLDMLHMPDLSYTFSGVQLPLDVFIVHVLFSIVFGIMYCVIAEYWPRIKMWQGCVFGFFVYLFAHVIVMPLMAWYRHWQKSHLMKTCLNYSVIFGGFGLWKWLAVTYEIV